MNIRIEQSGDIPAIHQVELAAFGRPAEADLADLLRAHGKATLSMVAVEDDQIVAHVLYSPVTLRSGDRERRAIGLGPVAVLPSYQGKGIGSALIRASLEVLRSQQHSLVFLEGNPRYYSRFGFTDSVPLGISCQFNPPPGSFMLLELAPSASGLLFEGTVFFAEEFEAVG